jgi:type IV secretion system pilin
VRKYSALSFAFIFSALFFLQTPLIFNQQILADIPPGSPGGSGVNITQVSCSCDNAGTSDVENKGGQVTKANNTYTCSDGYKDHCGHAEQQCIPANGQLIDPQPSNGKTGHRYSGITCQTTITCSCNTKTNQVVCTNPVLQAAGAPQSTKVIADCNSNAGSNHTNKCEQSTDFKNTTLVTKAWDQEAPGAECQVNCSCDHPGVTGDGNNGWTCTKSGACGNREDYCQNDDTAPGGHVCVNSAKCTCNGDKTGINCTAGDGPGNAAALKKGIKIDDQNESQSFPCASGQQCVAVNGTGTSGFTFKNQPITGVSCENVELPPPPSPPCAQWANGQCVSFSSGFGAFATDPAGFVQTLFALMLSVSGGIALLLIIRAGYQLMTSQGKPEQLQNGRDQLIAAIVGLVFLIFSFVFLELIGVDIFHIPGFSGANTGGTCAPNSCIQESLCTAKDPGHCNNSPTNGCKPGYGCEQ